MVSLLSFTTTHIREHLMNFHRPYMKTHVELTDAQEKRCQYPQLEIELLAIAWLLCPKP